MASPIVTPYKALVLFSWDAEDPAEISLIEKTHVTVLEYTDEGWALVDDASGSEPGWCPLDYLQPDEEAGKPASSAPEICEVSKEDTEASAVAAAVPIEEKEEVTAKEKAEEEIKAKADEEIRKTLEALSTSGIPPPPCDDEAPPPPPAAPAETIPVGPPPKDEQDACPVCGLGTSESEEGYLVAKNLQFHPSCFNCKTCSTNLADLPFIEKDGNFYCHDDYVNLFSPRCAECAGVIKGDAISSLGKTWHPEHFCCSECKEPFKSTQFHQYKEKPYCEKCFANTILCHGCGKGVSINGQVLEALGRKYHKECFKCAFNDHQMESTSFHFHQDKLYCTQHFKQQFIHSCSTCLQDIVGKYVKVGGHNFHPACWCCTTCKSVLDAKDAGHVGGKFYCSGCMKGAKTAMTASQPKRSVPTPAPAAAAAPSPATPAAAAAAPTPSVTAAPIAPTKPDTSVVDLAEAQRRAATLEAEAKQKAAAIEEEAKRKAQAIEEEAKRRAEAIGAEAEAKRKAEAAAAAAAAAPKTAVGKFTHDQLKVENIAGLPQEVDRSKREEYLEDDVFQNLFKMDLKAFLALPKWKRDGEKKKHGLF